MNTSEVVHRFNNDDDDDNDFAEDGADCHVHSLLSFHAIGQHCFSAEYMFYSCDRSFVYHHETLFKCSTCYLSLYSLKCQTKDSVKKQGVSDFYQNNPIDQTWQHTVLQLLPAAGKSYFKCKEPVFVVCLLFYDLSKRPSD